MRKRSLVAFRQLPMRVNVRGRDQDCTGPAVGENQSRRDLMKVAQYEVPGNDAKRNARPGRNDGTFDSSSLTYGFASARSQSIVPSETGHYL